MHQQISAGRLTDQTGSFNFTEQRIINFQVSLVMLIILKHQSAILLI